MTTIFENYNNICFNSFFFFYEQNINISHSIMTKLQTTQCYSFNKLNGRFKIFPEYYDFPRNFPDFPGFP